MAIFNSYVSLPEGKSSFHQTHIISWILRHTKSLRKVLTCDVRNGDDQAQGGRQTVGSEEQRQNANGHSLGILSLQIGQWWKTTGRWCEKYFNDDRWW